MRWESADRGPSKVGSRTPVRFGTGVEHIFGSFLQEYEAIFQEVTSEYLVLGYRREVRENQYIFVVVQGARFAGQFATEVALSRRPEYPYHRLSDEPRLAVGGLRERVTILMQGQDFSYRYTGEEDLTPVLREVVVRQSAPALRILSESAGPYLYREQQTWAPLYEEWAVAEGSASHSGGRRYPSLSNEDQACAALQDMLLGRKFDRFLGPMKFRYRDPRFYNCHLYLLARGLEFLVPPEPPEVEVVIPPVEAEEGEERPTRMLTWADILGPPPREEGRKKVELPPPLGDVITGITGRQPQSMCVELALDPAERRREFAFLKSLAAVEAYYEKENAP